MITETPFLTKRGNNIVVEFINGKIKIYDNPIGVMTNKPILDWHLTNLQNYINLDPYDKEGIMIAGVKEVHKK